jgi:hypothetical protein
VPQKYENGAVVYPRCVPSLRIWSRVAVLEVSEVSPSRISSRELLTEAESEPADCQPVYDYTENELTPGSYLLLPVVRDALP